MKRIVVLTLSIAINCLTSIAQNVLDLKDANNPIIIVDEKDTIKTNKEENCFKFTSKDNKPIIIKDVVFANNATEAKPAEIFIGDSLFKKWQSIKNDVEDVNFQIRSNNDISIIHGNKKWSLVIKKKTDAEEQRKQGKSTSGNDTVSKEFAPQMNYMTLACAALIMLVLGFLIGANRRRLCKLFVNIRFTRKNTVNVSQGVEIAHKDGEIHDKDGEIHDKVDDKALDEKVKDEDEVVKSNEENSTKDTDIQSTTDNKADTSLDEQIAIIIKGYEDEFFKNVDERVSKIERLQEILSQYYTLLNDKRCLGKELVNDENANTESLLHEIKVLKEKAEIKPEMSPCVKDAITISDLELIIKDKKNIKDVYVALHESSILDCIKQLFKRLNEKIENSIDINSPDDRSRAKKFVIDQLKLHGLKDILALLELKSLDEYFLPNTTLEAGLSKIKNDIKQCKSERNEESVLHRKEKESSSDLDNLVGILKERLPKLPSNINNIEELVNAISDLLVSQENTEPNEETENSIIINLLAQVGLQVGDKETAINKMKDLLTKDKELKDICKQYGADNIKELCNAIKEQIYKSVKGTLCKNEETKRIIENCRTPEGIVSSLSEAYRNADSERRRIENEQNAVVKDLNEAYVNDVEGETLSGNNLPQLFSTYREAVCQKIEEEKQNVLSLQKDNSKKQGIIDANNKKFDFMLNDMKKKLQHDFDEMQKSIQSTFIRPCDQNLKSQCEDNQSLLRGAFKKLLKQLQGAEQADDYEMLYKNVQQMIEKDMQDEHGLANVLSRYYAYSCLPFMTDRSREYGMRIDHVLMMKAFNALCHVVNQYGLQLIVPNLFADRIDDGQYQDCTGETYGDLENMCPGVANYVLEISNSDKQHYITDLVQIGYKKDEEIKVMAKVIIAD